MERGSLCPAWGQPWSLHTCVHTRSGQLRPQTHPPISAHQEVVKDSHGVPASVFLQWAAHQPAILTTRREAGRLEDEREAHPARKHSALRWKGQIQQRQESNRYPLSSDSQDGTDSGRLQSLCTPIGPQGPRQHGGTGQAQAREGVHSPKEGLLTLELGPNGVHQLLRCRQARLLSFSSQDAASFGILAWHLVAGCAYLACYPVTWCSQWGHAHWGPRASGHVYPGCTYPQAHAGLVSLHPLSSSQRKAGAHLQQGPPLLAHSPLGRPCSHQGRDTHQPLYPDRPLYPDQPLYPGPLLTSCHPLRPVPSAGAVVLCSAPDTKPFRVTSISAM